MGIGMFFPSVVHAVMDFLECSGSFMNVLPSVVETGVCNAKPRIARAGLLASLHNCSDCPYSPLSSQLVLTVRGVVVYNHLGLESLSLEFGCILFLLNKKKHIVSIKHTHSS